MISPCKGCANRICRNGEKCVDNAVYMLTKELVNIADRRNKGAIKAHSDILRQRKIDKEKKR